MATATEPSIDELNRQSIRLEAESRKLRAEAEKLSAEQHKLVAEQYKFEAERFKLERDKTLSPWLLVVQCTLAAAAIMGAGAALAKLFLA